MAQLIKFSRRLFLAFGIAFPRLAFARNQTWAQPVAVSGVPNLNQVAPNLYRSAQPTAEGFQALQSQLKVQTIVNLRESQTDAGLTNSNLMTEFNVPMNAMFIKQEDVLAALKLIKAGEEKGPVLLHCKHGADRTGVVIAMYRILYQGWTKEQAIDELENGGYNFHSIFVNIPHFIREADIAAYKRALAIAE